MRDLLVRLLGQENESSTAVEIRRVPVGEPARNLLGLLAPLTAARARGSRVYSCWHHRPGQGFTVVVGGDRGFLSGVRRTDTVVPVAYPPGAAGVALRSGVEALVPRLRGLDHWLRIGAFVDEADDREADRVTMLEDHLAFLAQEEFALLCVAVPVSEPEILSMMTATSARLHERSGAMERGTASRMSEALTVELREMSLAGATGMWRVHAFAGACSVQEAFSVASVWASVSHTAGGAGYHLAPVGEPGPLETAVRGGVVAHQLQPASPFVGSSHIVAALCRPPLTELAGIEARTTNPFDIAHNPGTGGNDITVGEILDVGRSPIGPFSIPLRSMGMHTFVHGSTGAGKSQATRHMLTELSRQGIPWVVLEPAKSEYASGMAERLGAIRDELPDPTLADVLVIRAGDLSGTPISINPLEPEPGAPFQAHLDVVADIFVAAFDAESPFPEVLAQGIDRCVRESGWDPALGRPLQRIRAVYGTDVPPYPDISDLVRACHRVIDEKGYGREVANNVHGFVDMRLATLSTGTKRMAFAAGYPLSMVEVLEANVVIELQDLGGDADRALFMGLFLARLGEAVRVRDRRDPTRGRLRNVVCIEEAHRLLRNPEKLAPAAARAVESFTDLLAEVRSLGVGLIVAEQIPSKISADVVKNTAVKCMGRTPAADDRAQVGSAVGLTEEQSLAILALAPGEFAVHADGMDHPVLVQFPYHPEDGAASALDPARVAGRLPSWFGAVAEPGVLDQRAVALAAQLCAEPQFVGLCELAVSGLLTGLTPPTVRESFRDQLLLGMAGPEFGSVVEYAVAVVVTDAAKSRATAFGRYSLGAFCREAIESVLSMIRSAEILTVSRRWIAPVCLFKTFRQELNGMSYDAVRAEVGSWIRRWDLGEPTGSIRDQLELLRRSRRLLHDEPRIAVLGSGNPSVLERLSLAGHSRLSRGLATLSDFDVEGTHARKLLQVIVAEAEHAVA